jgi:hypothetical protein
MASSRVFSARRGGLVFVILALFGLGLTLYLCAPGYMSTDSGDQLAQARSLNLRDDNPALMALIWRYVDMLIPGPLGMLLLMNALYWAGLGVIFWSLGGPLVARAIGLLVVGLYPTNLAIIPAIWKDMLMQASLVVALACLVIPTTRWRIGRYLAAVACMVVALGARHNAAAGVWPLLVLPLLSVPVLLQNPKWLRLLVACAASVVLTLGLTVAVDRTLSPFVERTEFWQMIPVFDLAGMSLEAGELLVEPESGVLTPGMGLEQIRPFYQPNYCNKLYYCVHFRGKRCVPVFRHTVDRERLAALSANWKRAIIEHPLAYLRHRRAVVASLIGIRDRAPGTFYLAGAPHHPLAADYPLPAHTTRFLNWIDSLVPSFPFRPWLYVLIGCALLPIALVSYLRGASLLPALYLLSGLSYMLGLFVATGSSPYRYTVWTTFTVVLALAALVIPRLDTVWARVKLARRGPAPEPAPDVVS